MTEEYKKVLNEFLHHPLIRYVAGKEHRDTSFLRMLTLSGDPTWSLSELIEFEDNDACLTMKEFLKKNPLENFNSIYAVSKSLIP